MSARINSYSLKNQSQDPYFAVAPQTTAEVSVPKKTVHWDRVAIVAAIGLAMVSAYLLSRGMFEGPQIICKTKPILLSKACPEVMKVLEESCAPNACLNLTDCTRWKIGQIDWYTTQLTCPDDARCGQLLNSARHLGSMFVEPFPYCITKTISGACPDVITYLQTACSKVSYSVRETCNIAANGTISLHGIFKNCICDINCENKMTEAKDMILSYENWAKRLLTPPSGQRLLTALPLKGFGS